MLLVAGCQTTPGRLAGAGLHPIKVANSSDPVRIHLTGDLKVDLPEELKAAYEVPPMTGSFSILIEADEIEGATNRSRYTAKFDFRITSPDGKTEYVNLDTQSDGEYEGAPTAATFAALRYIFETLKAYGQMLPREAE